jgi:hypothetical protein
MDAGLCWPFQVVAHPTAPMLLQTKPRVQAQLRNNSSSDEQTLKQWQQSSAR